jgi:hypothetical protein
MLRGQQVPTRELANQHLSMRSDQVPRSANSKAVCASEERFDVLRCEFLSLGHGLQFDGEPLKECVLLERDLLLIAKKGL